MDQVRSLSLTGTLRFVARPLPMKLGAKGMGSQGILYFLVNSAMPGLVKVGRTAGTVEARVRQLSATGVPQPFQVVATFYVADSETCEKAVHEILHAYRPNKNREFFDAPAQKLIEHALPVINQFLMPSENSTMRQWSGAMLDDDDVYFMQYLLHDGYEQGVAISTDDLVEHHINYAPLELEYKLLKLADIGMIERQGKGRSGLSVWRITAIGLKFMFESGKVLNELIAEARPSAQQSLPADVPAAARPSRG